MRIVIYGCGENLGSVVTRLRQIGIWNDVVALIDGDKSKAGMELFGYMVESADDYTFSHKGDIYIITPSYEIGLEISDSLEKKEIHRFLYYHTLIDMSDTEILKMINNEYELEKNVLIEKNRLLRILLERKDKQVLFFIEHTDPSTLKPATGELRGLQLSQVSFASSICEILNKQGIFPFMDSGNLLGLVRHNGYIPWDDDFDFMVMRNEYELLKDYCSQTFTYYRYTDRNGNWDRFCAEVAKANKGKVTCIESIGLLKMYLSTDEHPSGLFLDFFSMDRYRNDYQFSIHYQSLSKLKDELTLCNSIEEQYKILEEYMKMDKENWSDTGGNLFFGMDNGFSYHSRFIGNGFLNTRSVFPLKHAIFEEQMFCIPSNPKEYVMWEYGEDYMKLPKNAALYSHSLKNVRCG